MDKQIQYLLENTLKSLDDLTDEIFEAQVPHGYPIDLAKIYTITAD